jgi:hypothetical protein
MDVVYRKEIIDPRRENAIKIFIQKPLASSGKASTRVFGAIHGVRSDSQKRNRRAWPINDYVPVNALYKAPFQQYGEGDAVNRYQNKKAGKWREWRELSIAL